jgi:hypothetical protein
VLPCPLELPVGVAHVARSVIRAVVAIGKTERPRGKAFRHVEFGSLVVAPVEFHRVSDGKGFIGFNRERVRFGIAVFRPRLEFQRRRRQRQDSPDREVASSKDYCTPPVLRFLAGRVYRWTVSINRTPRRT